MTDRVRSAIVGTGFMGSVHAHAVHAAGAELVAVAGTSPNAAAEAADRLRAGRAARDFDELIESPDIDVVHICTPNHTHHELALAALRARKHVVCEKPLAVSVAQADELVDAAEQMGRVAAVPFVYRSYAMVREARELVRGGRSGGVRLLHGSYLQDWLSEPADVNWRTDPALGGLSRAFGDIGVHWCDLVEFVSGHRIVRLIAEIATVVPDRDGVPVETEDLALMLFVTDQGARGSLVVSQVSPGEKNRLRLRIDGADEAISFDQENPEQLVRQCRAGTTVVSRDSTLLSESAAAYSFLPPGHPQGYQAAFNAFVADVYQAIGGDVPDGLATFADGRRAAAITEAVIASARSGAWVEVE